ncbi:MAG: hypothetical protein WCJ64_09455 [Rhodospirillaceae bacterium]
MARYELKPCARGVEVVKHPIRVKNRPGTKNLEIHIHVKDEKRYIIVSSKTDDLDEAVEIAIDMWREIQFKKKHGIPIFGKNVLEASREWIEYMQHQVKVSKVTVHMLKQYDSYMRNHIQPYFGNSKVDSISKIEIDAFMDGMILKDFKKPTLKAIKTTLNVWLRWCQDKGYYRKQIPVIEMPKMKERRRPAFTEEEIDLLVDGSKRWLMDIESKLNANIGHNRRSNAWERQWYERLMLMHYIKFMIGTLARTNDLKLLRWRDITEMKDENGTVVACYFFRGKGKESYVSCSIETYFDLQVYSGHNHIFGKGREWANDPDDLVFSKANAYPPNSLKDQESAKKEPFLKTANCFKELVQWLGIEKTSDGQIRTPYSLRHSAITAMLRQKKDIYMLAKQSRTSISRLEQTYGHLLPRDLFKELFDVPESVRLSSESFDVPDDDEEEDDSEQ